MDYKIIDKRGVEPPKETCRVCGSDIVHSKEYNAPTMYCIDYLRGERRSELADSPGLEKEVGKLRELLAEAYKELSGKKNHSSDCATSQAPAMTPGRCDCNEK